MSNRRSHSHTNTHIQRNRNLIRAGLAPNAMGARVGRWSTYCPNKNSYIQTYSNIYTLQ